ncbi:hypothetical protein LZ198_02100 [Myxococcus sp. K15C18031901]|uniref:hypothetical protein n=1 Tax=Myxococcus dinghuensis TaxID=2906761 RepID=UPI0020A75875|nr:hypothetical protein [Myxococcus dinghuensis]MCP3097663.1 hypothetical protein [Myxococcus dinghuensis]
MWRRFWFEFESGDALPVGTRLGCGVSARDAEDAMVLLRERVFQGSDLPRVLRLVEDVDVSTLDAGHVLPNLGDVRERGVWFPRGHDAPRRVVPPQTAPR